MGYLNEFSSKLITILAVTLIAVGIVCGMIFYLNTTRVLSPVSQVTKAAELYAKGDFSQRLQQTGDPEMDQLTMTMNRMADHKHRRLCGRHPRRDDPAGGGEEISAHRVLGG